LLGDVGGGALRHQVVVCDDQGWRAFLQAARALSVVTTQLGLFRVCGSLETRAAVAAATP
jgi:hypothetical protein